MLLATTVMPPSETNTGSPSEGSCVLSARRGRWWIAAAVVLMLALAAGWYTTTLRFNEWLRGRVVATLEQSTGGRVEIESLAWSTSRLGFDIRNLTIHGREASGQIPYFHVDQLRGQMRAIMLVSGGMKLASLTLERPVFHLIVHPDGSTNQPVPRRARESGPAVGRFFELGAERLVVSQGSLLLNDRKLPLDLSAKQVWLALTAAEAGRRYDGELRFDQTQVNTDKLAPLAMDGSAAFTIWPDHAQLRELTVRSGASSVHASGELKDFAHPQVTAAYEAKLELARFGAPLGVEEARAGLLTVKGEGRWSERDFAAAGKLSTQEAHLANSTLRIPALTAGAEFSVTPDKIEVAHIFGSLFGGAVVGEMAVSNWQHGFAAASQTRRSPAVDEQSGELRLRGEHLLVARIAEALSNRDLPLNRARLAGRGQGTLTTLWRGTTHDAVTQVNIKAEPAAKPDADELPAAVALSATYSSRAKRLDIADLKVTTQATEFHLAGTLGGGNGKLNLGLDTRNLSEWKQLVMARFPGEWPFEARGRMQFQGTLSGRMQTPTLAGRVQVRDFDSFVSLSRLSIERQARTVTPRAAKRALLRWDALDASFEYSPSRFAITSASLDRGQTRLNFDLTAELRGGEWADAAPLRLRAEVRNGHAEELLRLFGDDFPVSGTVNGRWQIAGTLGDPRGSGSMVITRATLWNEPFERVAGRMELGGHEVHFADVDATHSGATLHGQGTYNLLTTAFRFEVRTRDLNLASVKSVQRAGANWSGLVSVTASGSGTADEPAINAELTASKLAVNGERIGDVTLSAVTKGDLMTINARSPVQSPALVVEGTARMRRDYPADIKIRAKGLNVDPLWRLLLKERPAGHFTMTGSAVVRGPLRTPAALHAEVDVDELAGEVEHIQLRNDGPMRVTLDDNVLRLDRVVLVGNDTNLTARGTVGLGSPAVLDLTARGRINLKLAQSFDRNLNSSGICTVNVQVNGTSARPLISGRLEVSNAGLSYADLPNGLSDIRGRLIFNQDRLQVEQLTARTGGGTLDIGGFVSYGQGLSFNLAASGRDFRLRYPPGVSTAADANLTLTGSAQSALLAGAVTITRFGVNPQFDFGPYLARARESVVSVPPESPASRLRLDIQVSSRPELQVETSLGRVSGDIDLKLRGTVGRPAVLGRVNIAEGNVSIYGTRYRIQRGDITFTSPVGIEPVLDIQATATVRSYDITLGFHGPINKLSTTYRSDPPLSTGDIVSLLAFGRTREETAAQSSSTQALPGTASYAILNQALAAAVTSRMQKIFGVSRIKIDPQMQSPAGLEYNGAGPTVTIEQQVANRLTVTYVSNLSRSNYQTIQAEYNVNRNVSIVAVRDWNGIVSFDIRVRQRRR